MAFRQDNMEEWLQGQYSQFLTDARDAQRDQDAFRPGAAAAAKKAGSVAHAALKTALTEPELQLLCAELHLSLQYDQAKKAGVVDKCSQLLQTNSELHRKLQAMCKSSREMQHMVQLLVYKVRNRDEQLMQLRSELHNAKSIKPETVVAAATPLHAPMAGASRSSTPQSPSDSGSPWDFTSLIKASRDQLKTKLQALTPPALPTEQHEPSQGPSNWQSQGAESVDEQQLAPVAADLMQRLSQANSVIRSREAEVNSLQAQINLLKQLVEQQQTQLDAVRFSWTGQVAVCVVAAGG